MSKRIAFVSLLIVLAIIGFFAWRSVRRDAPSTTLDSARPTERESEHALVALAPSQDPATMARISAAAPVAVPPAPEITSADATLRVLVIAKEDHRPLAHVRVLLRTKERVEGESWSNVDGTHGTMSTMPTTGGDGRVDFAAQPSIALHVSASTDDGSAGYFDTDVAALANGETREIVLELVTSDDSVFFGRVIDRETRAPITAATVNVTHASSDRRVTTRKTDADGRFELPLASWSRPTLIVTGDGHFEAHVIPDKIHDSLEHALVIELWRTATLRVRLIGAKGEPLPDARVSVKTETYRFVQPAGADLLNGGFDILSDWSRTQTTNAAGTAEFTDLPPGAPLMAEARRGRDLLRKELEPIMLKPAEVRDVEWRAGGGCVLTGRVIDQDDKPVTHRALWLMQAGQKHTSFFQNHMNDKARGGRTDDDGRFSFNEVAAGAWWVGPANDRNSYEPLKPDLIAPIAQFVEITEGESKREIEIRADRGLYIRGHVFGPDGAPPRHAYVQASQATSRLFMGTNVDKGKEFAIGPLTRGRYAVTVMAHGDFCPSDAVECEAGTSDLVLRLKTGGTISGTVIDGETNQPIAARVGYSRSSNADSGWSSSQSSGVFSFGGLVPDVYEISATDSRDRVAFAHKISVGAGEEAKGVTLVLEAGAHVRVHYTGDEPYGNLKILASGAVVAGDAIQKGTMREFGVPKGSVTLVMWLVDANRKFEHTIELAVGETKDVEFEKDWH